MDEPLKKTRESVQYAQNKASGMAGASSFVGVFLFVAFIYAGVFKGDPRLEQFPVDLTLLFAIPCALLALLTFLRMDCRIPSTFLWIAVLYLSLSIPLLWTKWGAYPVAKVTRMFTVTLLAMAFPLVWILTRQALRYFFICLALVGAMLCVEGLFRLFSDPFLFTLEVFSGDYIALGRVSGILALWLILQTIHGHGFKKYFFLLSVPFPIAVMVGSGARGPAVSFIVTLFALVIIAYLPKRRFWTPLIAAAVVLMMAATISYSVAPRGARARFESFAKGELGFSGSYRIELFRAGISNAMENPQGIGWGGFERIWTGAAEEGRGEHPVRRYYPHNLLIETFLEGGWIAGFVLLVVLGTAVIRSVRAFRTTSSPDAHLLFAVLFYLLAGAMFSGDWNDNRDLLALVSLALHFGSKKWKEARFVAVGTR